MCFHLSLLHFAPMLRYIKVGVNFLMILRRSSHAPRAIKCDGLKDSMREAKEAQKKSKYKVSIRFLLLVFPLHWSTVRERVDKVKRCSSLLS